MKKKKLSALLIALLAFVFAFSLAACGGNSANNNAQDAENAENGENQDAESVENGENAENIENDAENAETQEAQVLNVACSAVPHAEILEQIKETLANQGIILNIHVYGDYVVPNTAVDEGSEDANFFQHKPYLDDFNATRGTNLVDVAGIHVEPMGIYGGRVKALEDLPDGATIAVPNDPTNEGRALLLLENAGLITLKQDAGLEATPNDIESNPKNISFTELEAAMVPNILSEVDFAVINVNYALEAGLNPSEDALAIESADSPYVNIVVVKAGNENDPRILALVDALQSDEVREFITTSYGGAVVATF